MIRQLTLRGGRSRRWLTMLTVSCAVLTATGCSIATEAGSAVVIDGRAVPESSIQHDATAFVAENPSASITDSQVAAVNRAQITFLIRHALIARALADKRITVTDAEVASATATLSQQSTGSNIAPQLGLPAADGADLVHDVVALQKMVQAIPAGGVPVVDVSVTAEGVPAASRDQAVALRSEFLADPAKLDAAAAAAGSSGLPKKVYSVIQTPSFGSAGLYQPSTGTVVIVPSTSGYFVLRTANRTVPTKNLTQADFSAVSGLAAALSLGALLLVPYEGAAHISVNPRYGVWDPSTVQVVPGNDGL